MQEASSHIDPRSSALPPWAGAEEATESSAEADAAPSCESRTADTTQAGATPYDETAATAEADASSDGPTTAACNASADQSAAEPHSAEAAELGGDSSAVTDVCVPTETQVQKRSIIEKLLRSTAPWPDTDYQQLARDAGEHQCLYERIVHSTGLQSDNKQTLEHYKSYYQLSIICHVCCAAMFTRPSDTELTRGLHCRSPVEPCRVHVHQAHLLRQSSHDALPAPTPSIVDHIRAPRQAVRPCEVSSELQHQPLQRCQQASSVELGSAVCA